MPTCTFKSIRSVLALALIVAAPTVESAMYRWIDQNGAINYSDQLPQEPAKVRALTVLDAPAPATVFEKRSQHLIDAHSDRRGSTTAGADSGERGLDLRGSYGRGAESGSGEMRGSARLTGIRPSQPEAPRDPCLRSSDPRCYEKNRDAYVPFLGYAPSMTRGTRSSEVGGAMGATSAVSASGSVGGTVDTASNTVSPQRVQPWRLRNSLKDAKDLPR